MIDKRFTKRTIDNWESYIVDNETGEEYGTKINPLLDLLNELHEEKEHLKQSFNEVLKDLEVTTFDKELLEKENEQLKNELQFRNCVGKSAQILTRSDWEDLK